MDPKAVRIVVVGAGQAGLSLVARLRALGHAGPLTLVGAEVDPPYQRPPLSKAYLKGEMARERLWLRPLSFYREAGIELVTGARVMAIDRAAKAVMLADGRRLAYDLLALTTGALPRRLPPAVGGDLDGVFVMRGLADADALAAVVRPGMPALIVGRRVYRAGGRGGAGAEEARRDADRAGAADPGAGGGPGDRRLFPRPACAARRRRPRGRSGRRADRQGRPGDRGGAGGRHRIPGEVVLVGIGVTPDTALAEAAGLAVEDGILVDAAGRTSDPAIFAAGDCTRFPRDGGTVRLESVPNAIDQGEAVAEAMLGLGDGYVARPWFWSDQYDVKLQIAGLNAGWQTHGGAAGQPRGQPVGLVFRGRRACWRWTR